MDQCGDATRPQPATQQTFIREPILTSSGFFEESEALPNPVVVSLDNLPTSSETPELPEDEAIALLEGVPEPSAQDAERLELLFVEADDSGVGDVNPVHFENSRFFQGQNSRDQNGRSLVAFHADSGADSELAMLVPNETVEEVFETLSQDGYCGPI